MNFTEVNQSNIEELCISFEHFLTQHHIIFKYVDMTEEDGVLSFIFCNNPEQARSVELEAGTLIGLDTDYIAKEILQPILPRLKEFASE